MTTPRPGVFETHQVAVLYQDVRGAVLQLRNQRTQFLGQ